MTMHCRVKTGMVGAITLATVVFATVVPAIATTHIVKFGGTVGLNYSPKTMNVSVGDTVKWEGDFSTHPLSSTSVPAGAATFHHATGTLFSYHVLVAGTYQYRCDIHSGSGMTGSFTASGTGIGEDRASMLPIALRLEQNYPNPFNAQTSIRFDLPVSQKVTLKVYSILGKEMATLVDGVMPAGSITVPFDASGLASGVYFFKLVADRQADSKRFVLLK